MELNTWEKQIMRRRLATGFGLVLLFCVVLWLTRSISTVPSRSGGRDLLAAEQRNDVISGRLETDRSGRKPAGGAVSDRSDLLKKSGSEENERFLVALFEMKAADGKDNAMIHYAGALSVAPAMPTEEQKQLIAWVLENGWDSRSASLLPYLLAWETALQELRTGNDCSYSQGLGYQRGFDTPLPDLGGTIMAAKMSMVRGRYYEARGENEKAALDYLAVLKMGRNFTGDGQMLPTALLGASIRDRAAKQAARLAASGALPGEKLKEMMEFLRDTEQGERTAIEATRAEQKTWEAALAMWKNNPVELEKLSKQVKIHSARDGRPRELGNLAENLDKIQADSIYLWNRADEMRKRPWWERNTSEDMQRIGEIMESLHPLTAAIVPDLTYADVKFAVASSRVRQAQIASAARLYAQEKSTLAASQEELVSSGYLKEIPVDPFTGKAFHYQPMQGGKFEVYGSGPSSGSDSRLLYDPTNGTVSPGIVSYR